MFSYIYLLHLDIKHAYTVSTYKRLQLLILSKIQNNSQRLGNLLLNRKILLKLGRSKFLLLKKEGIDLSYSKYQTVDEKI